MLTGSGICSGLRNTWTKLTMVKTKALEQYALDADTFSTGYSSTSLPSFPLEDKMSIIDFTSQGSSKQAGKGRERKGYGFPMGLVGDSLVEPFGPEGLGISKSFLRVFDTAWMAKRFKKGLEDLWS